MEGRMDTYEPALFVGAKETAASSSNTDSLHCAVLIYSEASGP